MSPAAQAGARWGVTALLVAAAWLAAPHAVADGQGGAGPAAAAPADEALADGAPPAAAGEASAGEADGIDIHVQRADSGLVVDARCVVRAPAPVAWAVLTDYDGIDRFVRSMRESRVIGRGPNHALVEQVAVSRLFLFRRQFRATLFVEEIPPNVIRFEDVLGKDFENYRGEWRLEEEPGGVAIVYRVTAQPHVSVPDFLARGLFRRTALDLLTQLRTEIERRAALAPGSGAGDPARAAAPTP